MKAVFVILALLAADDGTALEYGPVRGGFVVTRYGSGSRLYHGRYRGFAGEGFADLIGLPGEGEAGRTRVGPVSLFPEFQDPEKAREVFAVAARKRARGGAVDWRLEPASEADRARVTRVDLRTGADGTVRRVRIVYANGDRETRRYEAAQVPAGEPGRAMGEWPPERAAGSPLEARLTALRRAAGEIRDVRGRFVREKRTILLAKPSTVTGTFRYVDGRLLWIDEAPRRSMVLVTRESMSIYDPENRRLERFSFSGSEMAEYVFLGFGDPLAEGLRSLDPVEFESAGGRVRLVLDPPPGHALARHVHRLTLEFDGETGLLALLAYEDPDGDSVTTRLSDVRRNTGLTPDDVRIDPAEGTRVIEHEGEMPWR
jgi:hypothetical protein